MLSIGEFSKICEVSTKTLRYYDEIGLISPSEINPKNGYRYYAIEQLETMLFINRLKLYHFSLDEIKEMMEIEADMQDEKLYVALNKKKRALKEQMQGLKNTVKQLESDLAILKQGKSILSYLDHLAIQLVEMPTIHLVATRKMVKQFEFPEQYRACFNELFQKIESNQLTIVAPPMVMFHDDEFTPYGLDTEFAIPIKEDVTMSQEFNPGLCLKTVLKGAYTSLPFVYTKQCQWAEQNGYENNGALYEVYVTDPSQVSNEDELVTEVYYPVKKKLINCQGK